MEYPEIIRRLEALVKPDALEGMAPYGLGTERAYGVSIPNLRALAKEIGKDHALAQRLWEAGYRETRILACMVDRPREVTEEQMERWTADFADWEVCDQCCMNLWDKTPFACQKAVEWAGRDEEFVKRAGFALMARLAWVDKKASNEKIAAFLPIIEREADDDRNYVKKAVNWALRQIGKRNLALNRKAIETAERIQQTDSAAARWVAADALRELTGEAVQKRLAASEGQDAI